MTQLTSKVNNLKIKVLVGISGSGKSTYAKEYCENYPNWVRVNRDSYRELLTGQKASVYNKEPNRVLEQKITDIQHENILYFLSQNYNVIIDNTHLQKKYVEEIINKYNHLADIELVPFETEESVCKNRVFERDGVDTDYIVYQHLKSKNIFSYVKEKSFYSKIEPVKQNHKLPQAYIFDIDGTLSDSSHRDIYDGSKAGDDKLIDSVGAITAVLDVLETPVVFLSGRSDKYYDITEAWLEATLDLNQEIKLFMRKEGDNRRDSIVKEELFRAHVLPCYYTVGVFDDRLQVLEECWRKLGLFTFNVNQGNVRF
jgi:predicted kinase